MRYFAKINTIKRRHYGDEERVARGTQVKLLQIGAAALDARIYVDVYMRV